MNRGASPRFGSRGRAVRGSGLTGKELSVCGPQKSPAPPSPSQPQTHSGAPCIQMLQMETMRGWERGSNRHLEKISPPPPKNLSFNNCSSPGWPDTPCKGGGSILPTCSPPAGLASLDVGFPRKNSWLRELCGGLKRACRKTQPFAMASSGAGPS